MKDTRFSILTEFGGWHDVLTIQYQLKKYTGAAGRMTGIRFWKGVAEES
jgi:hypothetical protein